MSTPAGELDEKAVESFLSGKLAQVDVVAIERELRKLWQEAEAHGSDAQGRNVARACVLNLILYTGDGGAERSAGDLLDEIMLRHPCRALLAITAESDKPQLEAWVSARCHLAGAGSSKQICCEQIAVRSEGQGIQALPSVVIPLLIPDLPVFLWWRTGGFDGEALKPFIPAVDRLIVDSLKWPADTGFFRQASVFAGSHDFPAPADLNWGRLVHWRHLIAKSFDTLGLGLNVSDLKDIESLRLEYVPPGVGQVALLTGWLAGQLSWRPVTATADGADWTIQFERGRETVTVEWVPRPSTALPEGCLYKFELPLLGERTLGIRLQLMDNKPSLVCAVDLIYGTTRVVLGTGPELDESLLVGKQLDVLERDRVFERSLTMAARIVELLQAKE